MLNFKKISQLSLMLLMVFALANCKSKKTEEQATTPEESAQTAPQIDSTPMNFDAAGSDSGKIAGLETIHFDYDKSSLKDAEKKKIKGNVAWMKSHTNVNVQIEGHCDARGSIEYNLALGERRAKSVKSYMVNLGIPEARLSVISYGKEKPVAKGDGDDAYAKNRRANFVPLAQ